MVNLSSLISCQLTMTVWSV